MEWEPPKTRFWQAVWRLVALDSLDRGSIISGTYLRTQGITMQGPTQERWQEVCSKAAVEQDPKKLLELTAEIMRLLDEKENRLRAQRQANYKTESAE